MAFTSVILKINIVKDGSTLTMQVCDKCSDLDLFIKSLKMFLDQFDRSMLVCDACHKIFQRASHDDKAQCKNKDCKLAVDISLCY